MRTGQRIFQSCVFRDGLRINRADVRKEKERVGNCHRWGRAEGAGPDVVGGAGTPGERLCSHACPAHTEAAGHVHTEHFAGSLPLVSKSKLYQDEEFRHKRRRQRRFCVQKVFWQLRLQPPKAPRLLGVLERISGSFRAPPAPETRRPAACF